MTRPMTHLPLPVGLPAATRRAIRITDSCWLWTYRVEQDGYAKSRLQGNRYLAHRLVYMLLVGPIPEGLELDHLCRETQPGPSASTDTHSRVVIS